ncbi:Aldo/keto reductase [Zopfia rhizophila CBS 207.26]|uniref:Aldo/keto reductase n=1 Tax=Zopfia rhizophila CBS 207.26 TaxID=1314779 RepID=A0A6A6EDB5_9PEZI|nr:Aldo/keto reductase [Zopfia rhizophila CBS 207.26]
MTFGLVSKKIQPLRSVANFVLSKHRTGRQTTSLEEFGQQEAFTAAVGWKGRGLNLVTKLYPIKPGLLAPDQPREQFATSLSELQTDSGGILSLHAADRSIPFAGTLGEVHKLYREGKFKEFGLRNFAAFDVAEIMITSKSIETELILICRWYGIDIVTYNGLAGALFTGKYNANNRAAPENLTQVGRAYRARFLRNALLEALGVVEPVVNKYSLTLVETALRWLVRHSALRMRGKGGNDGFLTGASSLEQFKLTLPLFGKGPLPNEIARVETPDYWFDELKYDCDTTRVLF